jgi:hypothetical protein
MNLLVMNRKIIVGLVVFGIAGVSLALSAYFLFKGSGTYTDGSWKILLFNSGLFGIIGGLIGSLGAWFVISGYWEERRITQQTRT